MDRRHFLHSVSGLALGSLCLSPVAMAYQQLMEADPHASGQSGL